jgi:hypothetical protein
MNISDEGMDDAKTKPGRSALGVFRKLQWTPVQSAVLISAIAIALGCLFITAYSLALGDPVPHRIDAALIGNQAAHSPTVNAVERVARDKLVFHHYASVPAALRSMDEQHIYAALNVTSSKPTLYVASAAGTSVARVLEGIYAIDPNVHVVDTHPVASDDPNGLDIFYLMLVTTIVGFSTVLQIHGQVPGLQLRNHLAFVLCLALAGSLVLTLFDGPLLNRPAGAYPEEWAILAFQLLAVASFTSLMVDLVGRWAVLPTWLFFVVLGNASSGGAVSPALLPLPFAILSKWLPSGAAVGSLRNAIYFRNYQHARPLVVLAVWAFGLFISWQVVARRKQRATGSSAPGLAVQDAIPTLPTDQLS